MATVNKVILIGNLGADPEIKTIPSGQVTYFSLATTKSYKDKATGGWKEQTEWHRVVFFGRLAEIAGQYLNRGSSVYIEGKLRTRKWQGKDGIDRYTTEIVGDELVFIGKKDANGPRPPSEPPIRPTAEQDPPFPPVTNTSKPIDDWDDIPF